jgi:hypothetical protein
MKFLPLPLKERFRSPALAQNLPFPIRVISGEVWFSTSGNFGNTVDFGNLQNLLFS